MSRIQKVLLGTVAALLLFGAVEILAPVGALAGPPVQDPNCKRACPPTKKHNGFPCTFAGCDPVTGNCMYAC